MSTLRTLALNKAGMLVNVLPWDLAYARCYTDITLPTGEEVKKAVAVVWHEEKLVQEMGYSFMIPSVIQYPYSDYMPKNYVKQLPFNRKNLWIRDRGMCMYCGKKVSISSFSFEHVIPKCLGGKGHDWLNIVVSCLRCNAKKGGRTPEQANMPLIRKPFIPSLDRAAPKDVINKIGGEIPYKTWLDYVYWNIQLVD
jgi:5-methylcytosine-specific restriction endonuclease McrA